MADEKRHFDAAPRPSGKGGASPGEGLGEEDLGFAVSPRFSEDLGELFTPAPRYGGVPADIDRAVVAAARKHLVRRQLKLRWVRWAVPTAAAAAVIVGACVLFVTHGTVDRLAPISESKVAKDASQAYETSPASTVQADIDRNGRVDILDAFKLARHIESGYATDPGAPGWDINGDGLVNREDVDKVAFAAVRLDKGIL